MEAYRATHFGTKAHEQTVKKMTIRLQQQQGLPGSDHWRPIQHRGHRQFDWSGFFLKRGNSRIRGWLRGGDQMFPRMSASASEISAESRIIRQTRVPFHPLWQILWQMCREGFFPKFRRVPTHRDYLNSPQNLCTPSPCLDLRYGVKNVIDLRQHRTTSFALHRRGESLSFSNCPTQSLNICLHKSKYDVAFLHSFTYCLLHFAGGIRCCPRCRAEPRCVRAPC